VSVKEDEDARASIVRYLRHVATVEVGTLLGIFGPQARELTDMIAGWVENRLDEKWAGAMRAREHAREAIIK
jgi:hypothetical protein